MVSRLESAFPGTGPAVMEALGAVPRHLFAGKAFVHLAYDDRSLPIGGGQTLSRPATVLRCLDCLDISPEDRLLEIGSGSGYLAAVASRLCARVVGMEARLPLVHASRLVLDRTDADNVTILYGDGSGGCPARAPFDVILLSASSPRPPLHLWPQLSPGGRLGAPCACPDGQRFRVWVRRGEGLLETDRGFECEFVPLTGEMGFDG